MTSNKDESKAQFIGIMSKYFDTCIPLTFSQKELFFLSPSNSPNNYNVIGFDIKHSSFFEPNSNARFQLLNTYVTNSFNETNKNFFELIYQHKFSELQELKIKVSSQAKYQGVLAFYSFEKNTIFLWNLNISIYSVRVPVL
jgi:hypothetical protein